MTWEWFDGTIPGRVMFVQAFGHGPVYYRTFGQFQAICVHPGCLWRGPARTQDDQAKADAVAHLEIITGTEWNK